MQDFFNQIISYHDLINGPLVPKKMNAFKIADHFNSEQLECKDMILGKFKKVDSKITLIEELRVSTAHPLANIFFNHNELDFPNDPSDLLRPEVFDLLELNAEKIKNQYFHKKLNGIDTIGIPFESEWSEIDKDRLIYGFINLQLQEMETENINTIRRLALIKSEEVFRKGIFKFQRIFNSYLKEIINDYELTPSDLKIKVKPSYSRKDCAILVYRSIVKVLDFISTTFYDFMDLSQQIPYCSKLLNENHFVNISKKIIKHLKQIELDDRLMAVINDELNKVLSIDISNRMNYREFDFYNEFLKSFNSFLQRQKYIPLNQEDIIRFLLSNNLTSKSFFELLIDDVTYKLCELDSINEKKAFLYNKRKKYQQVLLNTEIYVNVDEDEDNLTHKLLKFINIELNYLSRAKELRNYYPKSKTSKFNKLTTSFNTKEIAIICRLFKEVGVFKEESISDIAKWVPNTIKNNTTQFRSHDSIRNKMYNMDDKSFKNVKSVLFEMYNFKIDDFRE